MLCGVRWGVEARTNAMASSEDVYGMGDVSHANRRGRVGVESQPQFKKRRLPHETIEVDAQVVVCALGKGSTYFSYYDSLMSDCKALLTDLRSFHISYIRRLTI
ncbi:hypothetical protein Sjap_011953 [Stephania japonica]|uniref:Uncharacterized protein n=1 Tax=Stephania japonica TaxID=461633 RepID=A0AAP0JCA3_9MAGN